MIYIETNMKEMPKGCDDCNGVVDGYHSIYACSYALNRKLENEKLEFPKTRPEWCPLKSINDLITKKNIW